MATPTRTMHPLPFEHLEPHRFEDLIRQLAYEFRTWRALEATGRSGNEGGYDVRGWEVVADLDREEPSEDAAETLEISTPFENDREWLIQCKREKSIGPAKLAKILDEIGEETLGKLYGLVFACSCDLSKNSRDILREMCRDAGLAEYHVWSRGELEDMLFQPKNDGLLFAYFGISLKIRRRSLKTEIRGRLAIKRKVQRAFGGGRYLQEQVLLRDPNADRYPFFSKGVDRKEHHWLARTVTKHHARGVIVEWMKYSAYLAEDGIHWDAADACNNAPGLHNDPWHDEDALPRQIVLDEFCEKNIDQECRGTLTVTGLLYFEDIIELDQEGDVAFEHPHIYVSFENGCPPFRSYVACLTVPAISNYGEGGSYEQVAEPRKLFVRNRIENRVEVFPEEFRKLIRD